MPRRNIELLLTLGGKVSPSLLSAFKTASSQSLKLTNNISQQAFKLANNMSKQSFKLANSVTKAMPDFSNIVSINQGLELMQKAINGVSKLTGLSDTYVLTNARLKLINDGLQTTKQLQDDIFKSAQRTRAPYEVMAASVAKLGLLAKDSFKNNKEALVFTELVQKTFKIAGATTEEQSAGTYQLAQAMAAGKLQGDEFRSIMENAPMIADAISKYLKIPKGVLKELSSEGLITADVIKDAMFIASDDINNMFTGIPKTFGDVATSLVNISNKSFAPIYQILSNALNSPEATAGMEKIANFMGQAGIMAINAVKYMQPLAKQLADKIIPYYMFLYEKAIKPLMPYVMQLGKVAFSILNSAMSTLIPIFQNLISKFMPLIQKIMPIAITLFQKFDDMLKALSPTIMWLANLVGTYFVGVFNNLFPIFQNIIDILGGVMDFITGVFTGNWSKAWQGIKDILANVFKGVVNVILLPLNQVFNKINLIIEGINTIKIPDFVPVFGGKNLNIPKLPTLALANGATLNTPTYALLAEAGYPETVVPHKNTPRSRALLADAAQGVGMKVGGNTVNFHYHAGSGGSGDFEEFKQKVKQVMDDIMSDEPRVSYG